MSNRTGGETPLRLCSAQFIVCASCGKLLHDVLVDGTMFYRCRAPLASRDYSRTRKCDTWNRVDPAGHGQVRVRVVAPAERGAHYDAMKVRIQTPKRRILISSLRAAAPPAPTAAMPFDTLKAWRELVARVNPATGEARVTVRALAVAVGAARSTVARWLDAQIEAGRLERVGAARGCRAGLVRLRHENAGEST